MESLGYVMGAWAWGAPLAALVVLVAASVAVSRWRRETIVGLERAELDVDGQRGAARSGGASAES
ncbi:hypothetical protein [Streptomyces sp. NBC_01353]|uniref:hypothetical protein n=1 Tax=Streptomyces sp. NBC_01353 TaxID=2903835 RepID=UPI002E34D06A|nr:hypothetical protein [Streptomyces sp. NBC_01353]